MVCYFHFRILTSALYHKGMPAIESEWKEPSSGDYVTGQGTFYFIIINKHGDGLATFLMGFLQHAFKYIISHDPYKGSVK